MKNQREIYDRDSGLAYSKAGDYYIPDLIIPREECTIEKWGRLHRDYLKEHRPVCYSVLITTGQLWPYLSTVNAQAKAQFDLLVGQMQKAEGVTEALKERAPMAWVQHMNNIHNRAEEIVLHELIYV